MDDHLSLAKSEVEVSTCTSKTTNPSSSLVTADIEHVSLAENNDEQLLSNNNDMDDVNATCITDHSHLQVISRKKLHVFSRKVLHYRKQENLSSLNLCQSESVFIDDHGESQTPLCLPEMLKITTYTKDSDAECARKEQFLNVHGTVYILDHIDSTGKRKNARRVHSNKKPPLKKNNKAENKMDDVNQSVNLSSVQNQIKMENIDQTSDFLHRLKQIETASLSNGSNMQTENIQQPSDRLQGQKQTRSQILTNGNFTDFNYLEYQTHPTQIKQENVQGETPTLNHYQEKIFEYKESGCTSNLDNNIIVHKDGMHIYIWKSSEMLTAFVHDHNYYQVPEGDCETDLPIKDNKLNKQNNIWDRKREAKKLKAMEEKRKLEIEAYVQEQRLKTKLKEMEENRKLEIEATRREFQERIRIYKEQEKKKKEERLKAIEEKRKLEEEAKQPVPCPNCKEMIISKKMWQHKRVCSKEPFLCTFCGILLQTRRQLYRHEMYNHDESPKNCYMCHQTFKNKRMLHSHYKRHLNQLKKHRSKPNFLCSICGKTFAHVASLMRHTKTHSDEGPFKCSNCDAVFKVRGFYEKHMGFCQVSGKIFSCTESGCNREFQRKESWQKHIKYHQICRTDINQGPFKCSNCDAEFSLRSYLQRHIRAWHLPPKSFPCTESGCEKIYYIKDSLRKHKQWHQTCKADQGRHQNCKADKNRHQNCKADKDEGPFQCKDCDAEFKSRIGLQKHIGFCHRSEKRFSCTEPGCEKEYKFKDNLQRHEKWHQKCKTATGPIHTTRIWSGEENNILRAVFKEEISGKKEFDIEKMRRFIKKYPWVLKDVQTKNDLRLKRIRTKLYNERFLNKHSANKHGKTNTPSELSGSNNGETETPLDSELSDGSDTEACSPSELSDNNSGETEAHTL